MKMNKSNDTDFRYDTTVVTQDNMAVSKADVTVHIYDKLYSEMSKMTDSFMKMLMEGILDVT